MLNTGGGWKRGEGPGYEKEARERGILSVSAMLVHLQSIQLYLRSTRGLICDSDKSSRFLSSACSASLSAPSPPRMLVESMSIRGWDDDVLLPVRHLSSSHSRIYLRIILDQSPTRQFVLWLNRFVHDAERLD